MVAREVSAVRALTGVTTAPARDSGCNQTSQSLISDIFANGRSRRGD